MLQTDTDALSPPPMRLGTRLHCCCSMLEDVAGDAGKDTTQLDPREGANNVTGSGPATNFRGAATEGVTTWGPIMGGVVAAGGTVAIIGSMLPAVPYYQNTKLSTTAN